MRKPFAAGNWKMNLSLGEARDLATGLDGSLSDLERIDVAVCPASGRMPLVAALSGAAPEYKGCSANGHWMVISYRNTTWR